MNTIGLKSPENPDRRWEVQHDGWNFVITKTRQKDGSFIYSCKFRDSDAVTGFQTDRDSWTLEELLKRQDFVDFMSGKK